MATTVPYKDKNGKIISYQIQVFRGRDSSGKKLKPFTMSWKIPETYKSDKAIQKALDKVVGEFEFQCKMGSHSIDRKTFAEYANYYIELKERDSETKSIDFYNSLLPRLCKEFGNIRLSELNQEHLNRFYLKLQNSDVRNDKKAIANDKLLSIKKAMKMTHRQLCDLTGLCDNTVRLACQQKKVAMSTAEKISTAFSMNLLDLFILVTPNDAIGLSGKSINHYHTFIHALLENARRDGIININVAELASPPKIKKHDADFFEIDEILAIRCALDSEPLKYRIAIYLLIDSGVRRGELIGIRWKSVDFINGLIKIDNNTQYSKSRGLYSTTPKNDEVRTISIAPEIMKSLKGYKIEQQKFRMQTGLESFNEEGYLFIQENGNVMNPSTINHWMKKFAARNNLPHIYPHKFRHSQASILYASGVDIVTISGRLGHKQVSTTQNIYSHIMKDSDQKASEAIANALYRNKA